MIEELYKEQILALSKNPAHKTALEVNQEQLYGRNPLCGDEIRLDLKQRRFDGYACALCTASAELLCTILEERPAAEGEERSLAEKILTILKNPSHQEWEKSEFSMLKPLLSAHHFPSRLECIYLPWKILAKKSDDSID